MRFPALVAFVLFAALGGLALGATPADSGWFLGAGQAYEAGAGSVAGMMADRAIYIRGGVDQARFKPAAGGALYRNIDLTAWRGKRLKLSVRLRDDGDERSYVTLALHNTDQSGSAAARQANAHAAGVWQAHQFVLDVADNARSLTLGVVLMEKGRVWVDDLRLEAVEGNVAVTASTGFHAATSPYPPNAWLEARNF